MSRIIKTAKEVAFLKRVDDRYREGATVRTIAEEEKLQSPGALYSKLASLGFKCSRVGGLMLVDILMGQPLREWLASGELQAEPEPAEVA